MSESPPPAAARRRRRAVGPPGAVPVEEPRLELEPGLEEPPGVDDDERLLREVPPHHG